MAIKKLQNNYTSTEQSKRLLELGVPADSADFYWTHEHKRGVLPRVESILTTFTEEQKNHYTYNVDDYIIPCWSVGRLIEIYLTCALEYHPYDDFYTETPSLHLMAFDKDRLIEEVIEIMSEDKMDFSKLEE